MCLAKFENKRKNKKNQNHTTTHTTHRISLDFLYSSLLFICLLFSCLSSSLLSLLFRLLFSLSLSSFSVTLWHCVRVLLCGCCCGVLLCVVEWLGVSCVLCCGECGVVCGVTHWKNVSVCTFKTSPSVPAPRPHVETCARGAGIHGDGSDGHTGREGKRVVVSLVFVIG